VLAATVPVIGTVQPAAAAVPRFPGAAWNTAIGPTHLSSPVIADVNRDGVPDVITVGLAGILHVLSGRTGRDLPGWPQPVQVIPGQTVAVESSPTVADLYHNGREEIIVGAGSLNVPNQQGGVVVFNANGAVLWRFATQTVAGENGVVGTPAVGDVNGDGAPDVVFGSFDHNIYAVGRYGRLLPGFPFNSLDTVWDSPALYAVGGARRMDIFIGGDASPGGPCGNWSWAGVLRRIRVESYGPRVIWQVCQHQIFQSSPAIGNLAGRIALVIGSGTGPSGDPVATNMLKAFYVSNGAPLPGWPVVVNGAIFGSPVIGNITGDGRNDVVVAACAICNHGRVWAFAPGGRRLWSVEPGAAENDHTEILSTPILVDLDGNGVNDVAVGQAGEFYFLRGSNGSRLYQPIEVNRVTQNSAAVANFGRGIGWRLITQTWRVQGDGQPQNGAGKVSSYPLPIAPRTTPPWPQWRSNVHHTGAPTPRPEDLVG
jgi:hypothetical protein